MYMNTTTQYVISCGTMAFFPPLVLRDEPVEKYQIDLESYFVSTYKTFSAHLKKFSDLSADPDIAAEKELAPLLETLINTKEMILLRRIEEKK